MIAGFIFLLSIVILLQFFVSYTRSMIAASRERELSERAREICGNEAKALAGGQFPRIVQLIDLCPEPGGDSHEVRAVSLYFRLLGLARTVSRWAIPSAGPWIDAERSGCARVAAVVLDRRIAHNRTVMAQLASR
jgi:hypothetical protein